MSTPENDSTHINGSVRALSPSVAQISGRNTDARTWGLLVDSLGHIAKEQQDLRQVLNVSVVSAALWLPYFATPQAGRWEWDPVLEQRLAVTAGNAADVDAAIQAGPGLQSQWPADINLDDLGVIRTLTATQRRDTARMIALAGGANFSVPGAGKTTMTYVCWAALRERNTIQRAIVVAPLSAHEAWATEINDIFAPGFRPTVAVKPDIPHGDIVVVNYEQLESPARFEMLRDWAAVTNTLVIFDEAHRAKAGRSGIRGQAAIALAEAASHRCVLTGTPRPNGAADLVNIMDLAYPGRGAALIQSPTDLPAAYCRVTKQELGLPELHRTTQRVPLSAAHDRVYDAMVDQAARAVVTDPTIADDLERAGRIAMLLLQASTDPTAALDINGRLHMTDDRGADLDLETLIRELPASFVPTKFVRTAQIVDKHRAEGTKVLVWACFKSHVRRLADLLEPNQPAVVHGGVQDRDAQISRFRNDPACTVLIATPHTLSEGISLHRTTTHQVHVDRTYNAGMFLQSLDRTHRLGLPADAHCTTTYLVAERPDGSGTVDQLVARRLETKVAAMGAVLNDPALNDLALPDDDDLLSPTAVALGPNGAADLASLFAHLRERRS